MMNKKLALIALSLSMVTPSLYPESAVVVPSPKMESSSPWPKYVAGTAAIAAVVVGAAVIYRRHQRKLAQARLPKPQFPLLEIPEHKPYTLEEAQQQQALQTYQLRGLLRDELVHAITSDDRVRIAYYIEKNDNALGSIRAQSVGINKKQSLLQWACELNMPLAQSLIPTIIDKKKKNGKARCAVCYQDINKPQGKFMIAACCTTFLCKKCISEMRRRYQVNRCPRCRYSRAVSD